MNTGSALARFTITLSTAVTEPVQVEWYTSDGTAKASVDYAANKGTVVFAPGETAKTVDILVYGRAVGTEDRSFYVEMLPPTNAILGQSIGECIIHVDATGSTPVTQIIVPTGPQGIQGKSVYQSYLDTTTDNPPMTEPEWVESLKGDPEEIALEVAPLIDVGDTALTAAGTDALADPDTTTVKDVARRVAYSLPAKIATVVLADGVNTIKTSDLSGDAIDFTSVGFVPKIMRGVVMISPNWSISPVNELVINGAIAGDRLYAVQYDTASDKFLNGRIDRFSSAAVGDGDELITVKQSYASAVPRTQHDFNAQFISIIDFLGDEYDGTTDAAGAFISANTLVPKSRQIIVPSGSYLLNSDADCSGRRFVFEEPVTFTGTGKFYRAIVNRIMPDGTTKVSQWAKPGTTEYMTASAVFGDNGATATGIQIGGAVPYNGTDGVMMFTDGSSGWLGVRASKWPHPTEIAIYPSTKAGSCRTVSGSNAVKILSGASITAEAIGKPISIYDSLYTVSTITADGFTVKNINGTPVTWGSTATHSFILCYYNGSGLCSVSGTTVTRISGDPFVVPDPTVPQTMTINGTDYRVVSFTDPQHVTLNTAPGNSTSTEYKFWGAVNNLNSALRVHRLNAVGFEENISLIANNAGYFALHAAAGNPANEQYPIFIGSGWESNGQIRKSVIAAPNGDVTLCGNYGVGPLYVPYADSIISRPQVMVDNSTGTATIASTGGSIPDASLAIKAKGAGRVVFHSEVAANAAIYPYIDNVYSCGKTGNRWSQVWAANAVIQTSDGTTKTAVQESDLSTDFILGLNPVSYKNIVGGNVVEEVEDGVEEIERQVVEKVVSSEEVHERVVDGDNVYYVRKFVNKEVERPVFHDVELRDEQGNIIGTIKTPLMEKVVVPKIHQVITPVPGNRTHYGFIAQEVKDLIDKLGISDFGGYVEGEDGKLGLRYGEFIAPIVKTLHGILDRLDGLDGGAVKG